MSKETIEIPPGGGVDVDLTIKEGESILVIKEQKDGTISFPIFASNKTHTNLNDAIRLCQRSINTLLRSRE